MSTTTALNGCHFSAEWYTPCPVEVYLAQQVTPDYLRPSGNKAACTLRSSQCLDVRRYSYPQHVSTPDRSQSQTETQDWLHPCCKCSVKLELAHNSLLKVTAAASSKLLPHGSCPHAKGDNALSLQRLGPPFSTL